MSPGVAWVIRAPGCSQVNLGLAAKASNTFPELLLITSGHLPPTFRVSSLPSESLK